MSGQDQQYSTGGDAVVTITSQLMIAAVIFLFMVVVFIFFLYLYAKYYMTHPVLRRGSSRFRFSPSDLIIPIRRGLDIDLINSLPVKAFKAADFKEGLECSVCLSEVTEGEELRLLPNCKHGFHVKCIDMWFYSHTTCPLCRSTVDLPASPEANGSESAVFPTNGSREESSSSSGKSGKRPEGMLAIEIPRRAMEGFPPMSSPAEEVKTPMSGRLRSFRMLLSRGKRVIDSCSPRGGGDIEQGGIAGGAAGEGSSLAPLNSDHSQMFPR